MSRKPLAFISYRRDDARDWANLLADTLRMQFGPKSVFLDTDAIRIGDEWPTSLDAALSHAAVVIPVIGPSWLFIQDPKNGRRRIDGQNDWVRREVEYAISKAIPLLPVLVPGATIPAADDLPESIAGLSARQATILHDRSDVELVIKRLVQYGFRKQQTVIDLSFPPAVLRIPALTEDQISETLQRLPSEWSREQRVSEKGLDGVADELVRKYPFATFEDAMHFMATAARYISKTSHHPFWENQYQDVRVRITTWDVGMRLSAKDIRLAEYLDRLYREYNPPASIDSHSTAA